MSIFDASSIYWLNVFDANVHFKKPPFKWRHTAPIALQFAHIGNRQTTTKVQGFQSFGIMHWTVVCSLSNIHMLIRFSSLQRIHSTLDRISFCQYKIVGNNKWIGRSKKRPKLQCFRESNTSACFLVSNKNKINFRNFVRLEWILTGFVELYSIMHTAQTIFERNCIDIYSCCWFDSA